MSSSWGRNIKLSLFGESHGTSIGVVIDGLPAGIPLDIDELYSFMSRRAPGKAAFATARAEKDLPNIQSGYFEGKTTGTPLCAIIANTNTRSGDYEDVRRLARPAHADYTGYVRYSGHNDVRGGGHFSARLTAPLVFAGGIAKQILSRRGIFVGAHICQIFGVEDQIPSGELTAGQLQAVAGKAFPVFSDDKGVVMQREIEAARREGDSVGGVVACYALGVPAGIGSPMFDGLENVISSLVFGIPAVKGVEFGEGFACTKLRGSENNDPLRMDEERVAFAGNRHGGILGGISSGMPIVMRVAFKPTPSISKSQQTVDFIKGKNEEIAIHGRHDPCVVPRAVPCVEACCAMAILDCMLEGGNPNGFTGTP